MMPGLAGESPDSSQARMAGGRHGICIAILLCGAIMLYGLGRIITSILADRIDAVADDASVAAVVAVATAVYLVLLAIPFMPAVELGVIMLIVFGAKVSLLIYVSTVVALTLAYLVGRLLPAENVAAALGHLGLGRVRDFLLRLAMLSSEERLRLLVAPLPSRMAGSLIRFRFLLLAVLFNLPGNFVIGGGGGVALLAGMSRMFSFPAYLLTVVLAVAPVPLLAYFVG